MIRTATIVFALFWAGAAVAQQKQKTLWGSIEVGYGTGIVETGTSGTHYRASKYGFMEVTNTRLKAGYYISPNLSLGAGIGAGNYTGYDIRAVPVFADIRWHFTKSPNLFAFADIGASLFRHEFIDKGFVSELGAGYRVTFGKRCSLNPSVGYNLIAYRQGYRNMLPSPYPGRGKPENRVRHSICLTIAFEF
ncbi:MAG: hypothetical protein LBD35_00965 [Prevotellaceae bacterium]|nr:hypothetical protein [Prevotellaceae bacterium]